MVQWLRRPHDPNARALGLIHGQGTISHMLSWASVVVQSVNNLPAMQETWIRPLGQNDSLQKEMATHSSILAWRIPWIEEPGGLQSMGLQK